MDHISADAVFIRDPIVVHTLIPASPGGYLRARPVPEGGVR
ncbi:hypothetical protein QF032_006585 [Streptomyces achromogenes]|uniref:Uncharacterized protein n=1 Tax=Streptomyces achromogenes TaxID=67255 RepID=A0ABU0QCF8_STRAH|nr:hypothetical protein [Streptomyces achromogenes]MDQ0834741.1 hypothetical protein [Streptomyces achromogenes]